MSNPVSTPELMKALDDLILSDAPPPLEVTDITIQRIVARANVGGARAQRMIDKWVEEGKVEYIGERREPRGHRVKAWRLKGQ